MRSAVSASDIWSVLHGVICVHKPRDVSLTSLKKILVSAICSDANECIPPPRIPTIELPIVEPHPKSQALVIVGMRKQLDYSSHPLVVGQPFRKEDIRIEEMHYLGPASSGVCRRYNSFRTFSSHPLVVGQPFRKEDIRIEEMHYLGPASSGVCLFGINDGCEQLEGLRERAWINEYRLLGQLGRETHKNEIRGKVVVKREYDGVTRYRMQKLLSRVQAQYKRLAFELANVDLQSQEAFELACKGLPRAKILGTPIVYGISLNSFKAPHFSLTLNCVSETDSFLRDFIREIAISLGTTASCRRLLCSRIGPFDAEHSLLDKHFTLSNIFTNMRLCRGIIEKDAVDSDANIVQNKPHIAINEVIEDQLIEVLNEEPSEEVVDDCLRIAWGREYTQV
uniref:TruB_N domain-containing protein n=1 Tax=Ascaris lumbricoides TaxID=6252 RepID=A0A0M3IJ77_ASCLU